MDTPVIEPKVTRRSYHASNFTKTCFFCDGTNKLISCWSNNLFEHVKIWATYLFDARLIAKLSEGDMVAIEAQYHKKCLTMFFNSYKSKKRAEIPVAELLREIERKVLKDVVNYVKDQVTLCFETNSTPVFTQKSISDLYNACLIHFGEPIALTRENNGGSTWSP